MAEANKTENGKNPEFTKLLADLLGITKGLCEWGIGKGIVDQEDLKLVIEKYKRPAVVRALVDGGMSKVDVAEALNVSRNTVYRDLEDSVTNITESVPNGTESVSNDTVEKRGKNGSAAPTPAPSVDKFVASLFKEMDNWFMGTRHDKWLDLASVANDLDHRIYKGALDVLRRHRGRIDWMIQKFERSKRHKRGRQRKEEAAEPAKEKALEASG
jgi:hypothetical protein